MRGDLRRWLKLPYKKKYTQLLSLLLSRDIAWYYARLHKRALRKSSTTKNRWLLWFHQQKWIPKFTKNLRPSVQQLKVNRGWVKQQDNNPKDRSKSATGRLQQKKRAFWSDPVRAVIATQLWYYGMTSRELFPPNIQRIFMTWISLV